jgi:fatty-acid desaturase
MADAGVGLLRLHGRRLSRHLYHQLPFPRLGRQRYKTGDASRNNIWLALITLGEGWHNNHHHYPASVRQGFYWWEFDVTFYMLKLMSYLGVIWDLKPVPAAIREGAGKRL